MKILPLILCILMTATISTSAQIIGVDFNNDADSATHDVNDPGTGISPTFSEKGVLGEKFIGIHKAGKGIALSDGVTMDVLGANYEPTFRDQPNDTTNDLFRDYVQSENGKKLTIVIHGLKPKASYKLVGYGASTRTGGDSTTFTGALNGTLVGLAPDGTRVPRNAFVKGQNYLEGTAMADDTGSLSFVVSGASGGWGILNGFAIAPADAINMR